MDNIKNKTALVTGGASGLGLSYVTKLLHHGAKAVAILDLPTSAGPTTAANLEKQFGKGKAIFLPCDVANYTQFQEQFKKAVTALNRIDILINNAGILNEHKWEQTMRINVGGVIQGSLLAIDHMGTHKGGRGGTLINIASIVALDLYPVTPVYCASKHDVLAFTRCLSSNHENTGVRVLAICPGLTDSSLIGDLSTKVFDFITPKQMEQVNDMKAQGPEHVSEAMIKIIQTGTNGAIWVSEEEEQPYAIEIPPIRKIKITH